jgi:hypothetical protein
LQNFEGFNPGAGQTVIQNNLKITTIQKTGVWGYKVETSGNGLLELGQGFEKGWIGFTIKDYRLKIMEHTKVDSWANGWLVGDTTISNPNSTIYIVYWPQVLEWGGGILGLAAFLILLLKHGKRQVLTRADI